MGRAGPVFPKIRAQTRQRRATQARCPVEAPKIGGLWRNAGEGPRTAGSDLLWGFLGAELLGAGGH
jgi:hypothetical protein